MRLINFRCDDGHDYEELFRSGEDIPLVMVCQECKKTMIQFNLKNNDQVAKINDRRTV